MILSSSVIVALGLIALLAWIRRPAPRVRTVVIDGLIGAGKSTLKTRLMARLRELGVPCAEAGEPVGQWESVGIFDRFYEFVRRAVAGPGDVEYAFQTFAFVTRVELEVGARAALGAEMRARGEPLGVLVCERSAFTDRCVFVRMLAARFGPMYVQMYETWWDFWWRAMVAVRPEDWLQVYLRPSLATCVARQRARRATDPTRKNEEVDEAYQRALLAAHDEFLLGKGPEPAADDLGPSTPELPFRPEEVLVLEGAEVEATATPEDMSPVDKMVERILARL